MFVTESEYIFIQMVNDLDKCSLEGLKRINNKVKEYEKEIGADGVEFCTSLIDAMIKRKEREIQLVGM